MRIFKSGLLSKSWFLAWAAIACMGVACTGVTKTSIPSSKSGGFIITAGDKIEFDLTDLIELGFSSDLSITLKQASEDYKSTVTLADLTSIITTQTPTNNRYKVILPKEIAGIRPMILSVESPSLRAQFIDIIYADTTVAKPGIASTLAYDLLKYYPNKSLSNYSSGDFKGIKNLIDARIAQIKSQSEHISLSSIRFDRIIRFYKNSLAFYPTFLDAVRSFGINYTYSLVSPTGIVAADLPPGMALSDFRYAGNFLVNGVAPTFNPFNQVNNPSRLASANPGIGTGITAVEGDKITLTASTSDSDDDFVDKSLIVQYNPRVLPKNLPVGVDPLHLVQPERTSTYSVKTGFGRTEDPVTYSSDFIGFDEAINKTNYKKGMLADTDCDPADTDVDCGETAYRNLYVLITDGMIQIPYRWSFRYLDLNRAPKIIANGTNRINDAMLDDVMVSTLPSVTTTHDYGNLAAIDISASAFRQHASHCETDPTILEQNIRSKLDGPWSCTFKVYDPDLDADPNAAVDEFNYTVDNYESSTEIYTNAQKISPSATGPKVVLGASIPTCTDFNGVVHRKCGVAHYAITIDNSVKVSAATKASLEYSFDVVVKDRASGGYQLNRTLSRKIKFTPVPPRLVNFDSRQKPLALPAINQTYSAADQTLDPTHIEATYPRSDIFVDEIIANSKSAQIADSQFIGFKETLFEPVNRPAFHFTSNGVAGSSSAYLTQPRAPDNNVPTFNASDELQSFTNPVPHLHGNTLGFWYPNAPPTGPFVQTLFYSGHHLSLVDPVTQNTYGSVAYSYPREYDTVCQSDENNFDSISATPTWDQRPIRSDINIIPDWTGGWTFELNVIDLDNIDLRPSEPYEPVYVNLSHDANVFGDNTVSFCQAWEPNPDARTYDTYASTTTSTGVTYPARDREDCNWGSAPKEKMQPISVFYQTVGGDKRKLVYHRMRGRWRPRDPKSAAQVANFIQNKLKSVVLYGDRYKALSNKSELEAVQDRSVYSEIQLTAGRIDHKPCAVFNANQAADYTARYMTLHDSNTATNDLKFKMADANRWGESGNSDALSGQYQAEIVVNASNTTDQKLIDSANLEFARFVPFVTNCTPPDGSPLLDAKPMVWYAGATKLPRARMISKPSNTPFTDEPFCFHYGYTAYKEPNPPNRVFDKVALFQATGPATLDLTPFVSGGYRCFTEDTFHFTATETYLMLATPCSSISYSSGGVTGTILKDFNPTLAANSSFPAGTDLRLKFFAPFYGAQYSAAAVANILHFNVVPVDTFRFDSTTGLNKAMSATALPRIDTTASLHTGQTLLPLGTMPGSGFFGFADWDHQLSNITVVHATPTPVPNASSNVFYRVNTSGTLQIFVKGTNASSVPFQTFDRITGAGLPAAGLQTDPFDIVQYASLQPTASSLTPTSAPSFSAPAGRTSCIDAPGGSGATYFANVLNGTLTYASLEPYRQCIFNWTPATADIGKMYTYQFRAQDNFGATADPITNLRTGFGIGAILPQGIPPVLGFTIPGNSSAPNHGPTSTFNIQIESIEQNTAPYFLDASVFPTATTSTQKYCTAISTATGCTSASLSAGWVSVIGNVPAPTCSSSTGFACPGTANGDVVKEGDTLNSTTAVKLTEGVATNISIYVRDDNVTPELGNLQAKPPRKVLVINKGADTVKSYTVPSLATMTLGIETTTALGDGRSARRFHFDWKPTDAEAYQLSNSDGFLIPFVITDQEYIPAPDADFPTTFTVPAMTRTIWVWAQMKVKNNNPQVYYMSGTTEIPLSGSTLTFETGKTTSYTIRVKDLDRARYDLGAETSGFPTVASSKPAFLTAPGSATSVTASGLYLYQDYVISNTTLTSNEIGIYTYDLQTTDPGDPAKCWVEADGATCTNAVRAAAPLQNVNFNVSVVGKPFFLAPKSNNTPAIAVDTNTTYAYVNNPLNYPLSISISKASEKKTPFFFGINATSSATIPMRTTVTPASTPIPATSKGIYVNQNHVLKWPDATFDRVGTSITVPIYAVKQSLCAASGTVTLYRYNDTTNVIETCKLTAAIASENMAEETVFIKVYDSFQVPSLSSININSTSGTRVTTHAATTNGEAMAQATGQYSAFKGRCLYCGGSPSTSGASPSSLALNPSSSSGQVHFSSGNYESDYDYTFNGSTTLTANRVYRDVLASTAGRSITFPVMKSETPVFSATLSTLPTRSFYRWYVNGCLKKSGEITSTAQSFSVPITLLMSGLNNDCTGQYAITETGANTLGLLKVRLTISNSTEATSTTSDGTTKNYLWNVSILNNKPNLQTGQVLAACAAENATCQFKNITGATGVTMAMPIYYASKPYLAYTDVSSTSVVRFKEIDLDGTLLTAGPIATTSINSAPTHFGVHTASGLSVSLSSMTTYPASSADTALVYKISTKSYMGDISGGSFVGRNITQAYNEVAAYTAFSNNRLSTLPATFYQSSAGNFDFSTNSNNFYVIDGQDNYGYRAINNYWSNNINSNASIYGGNTSPLANGSTGVRKNLVSGTTLFQLIGAKSSSANGALGYINIRSLSTSGNYLSSSSIAQIQFTNGASAPHCNFAGTPLDGMYVASVDTLYVVAQGESGVGRIVAIRNATQASASCTILASVANPSLNTTEFNPNHSKMTYDANNTFIYGVISRVTGAGSQVYYIDVLTSQVYLQDLASTINPTAIIYSKERNAVLLMDGEKTSTKSPTLYKLW